MAAIGANNGRVLFLPHNNKNPTVWASIFFNNWVKIKTLLNSRKKPFVASLSPNGIWNIRELNKHGTDKKKRKGRH